MSKPKRFLVFLLAFLFFATSVATGALVIWQIREDARLSQVQTGEENKEGMLQGTILSDFTPVEKVDQLQVIDLQEGTGEEVKPGATVKAHYTGAVASTGVIFQSSHDFGSDPIEFGLSGVIKGWTEGVPGMKVGGKRRLIIPYAMAYGEEGNPQGGIPARADLVFDIELEGVLNQ